jgi:uncharacterized protein (DUF433 family)
MWRLPGQEHQLRVGILTVELSPLDHDISGRLRRLMDLKGRVKIAPAGEPVILGTHIPVYLIAGLAKGETVAEILADYPSLTRVQVETAIEYATAYPKKGRPYPNRSFKRMVAELGLEEIETERTEEGPRLVSL